MDYTQNLNLPQWEADDRIMHGDFNDAMSKLDAGVAERCKVITGTWTGNGADNRQLDFGQEVRAVFLQLTSGVCDQNGSCMLLRNGVTYKPPGGSYVGATHTGSGVKFNNYYPFNQNGKTYMYFALL